MDKIRLSKYFTDCGVMSRRAAEDEISAGRVYVNGSVAHIGDKILPGVDRITFHGKEIKPQTYDKICIMLNKPRGIVCTSSDEKGRRNVTDLISSIKDPNGKPLRLYPVGRLDMDSDGLLLLTNDGQLANKLTHPRHSVPKIYHVTLRGEFSDDELRLLGAPIELDGRLTMPVRIKRIGDTEGCTLASFELFEGRNRQIRKMCEQVDLHIITLRRISQGSVKLGDLRPGKWRHLTKTEVESLMQKE